MKPKVTCIILNFNGWNVTQECLKSLEDSEYQNFNIIIIDNNSDHSPGDIVFKNQKHKLFDNNYNNQQFNKPVDITKQIYTIKSDINGGFSYGINIGIKIILDYLDSDYVWILNNDTICNRSTLKNLVSDSNENQITGSTIISKKNIKKRSISGIHPILGISQKLNTKHKLKYIPFTSVLISRKTFELVGKLSENYFLYYEDVDFCVRAIKSNIKIKQAINSLVTHIEGFSSLNPNNKELCPDWIPLYSKKQFMLDNKFPILAIYFSLIASYIKRLLNGEIKNAANILKLILNEKKLLKIHHYYRNKLR